jgi:dihydrofolate reductase
VERGSGVAQLIYSTIASLDGYVADEEGRFAWAAPDEEVHAFVNDLVRPIGTHLYGRRMYETMAPWETDPALAEDSEVTRDFAEVWQAADKIVYSTTLENVATDRTRLEREFDPESVAALKRSADADLSIGGPHLAADAFRAGLIDECHLFLVPVSVGGGNPALPQGVRVDLALLEERRFGNGFVHLRYRVNQ